MISLHREYRRFAARACSSSRLRFSSPHWERFSSLAWCLSDAIDTWLNAPLVGVAQHLAGPGWVRDLLALALAAAAVLVLLPALYGALADAERMLHRASRDGALPPGLASLHTRFGTPARGADVAAAATVLLIVASGGRLAWLAQAYAIAIATMLALTIAALAQLRGIRRDTQPFRTPMNLRFKGREIALGLLIPGAIAVGTIFTMLALGDGPSLAAAALIGTAGLWFVFVGREAASAPAAMSGTRSICFPPPISRSVRSMRVPAMFWSPCETRTRSSMSRRRSRPPAIATSSS